MPDWMNSDYNKTESNVKLHEDFVEFGYESDVTMAQLVQSQSALWEAATKQNENRKEPW